MIIDALFVVPAAVLVGIYLVYWAEERSERSEKVRS
jgi:hypothetical protein